MKNKMTRILAAVGGAALALAAGAAQAQYVVQYSDGTGGYGYRTEPLYPYVAQPRNAQPAPQNTRSYPYVGAKAAVGKTDPILVEELRKRGKPRASTQDQDEDKTVGGKKIHKTIVVREKPIVRDHVRVVDDPPIIVQREVSEEQLNRGHAEQMPPTGRVIRAEAEVTILGPDRMSIRLFRRGGGSDANAKADAPAKSRRVQAKAEIKAETVNKIR